MHRFAGLAITLWISSFLTPPCLANDPREDLRRCLAAIEEFELPPADQELVVYSVSSMPGYRYGWLVERSDDWVSITSSTLEHEAFWVRNTTSPMVTAPQIPARGYRFATPHEYAEHTLRELSSDDFAYRSEMFDELFELLVFHAWSRKHGHTKFARRSRELLAKQNQLPEAIGTFLASKARRDYERGADFGRVEHTLQVAMSLHPLAKSTTALLQHVVNNAVTWSSAPPPPTTSDQQAAVRYWTANLVNTSRASWWDRDSAEPYSQLRAIGWQTIPELISHLEDSRLTRLSIRFDTGFDGEPPTDDYHYRTCSWVAANLLEELTCLRVDQGSAGIRSELEDWWLQHGHSPGKWYRHILSNGSAEEKLRALGVAGRNAQYFETSAVVTAIDALPDTGQQEEGIRQVGLALSESSAGQRALKRWTASSSFEVRLQASLALCSLSPQLTTRVIDEFRDQDPINEVALWRATLWAVEAEQEAVLTKLYASTAKSTDHCTHHVFISMIARSRSKVAAQTIATQLEQALESEIRSAGAAQDWIAQGQRQDQLRHLAKQLAEIIDYPLPMPASDPQHVRDLLDCFEKEAAKPRWPFRKRISPDRDPWLHSDRLRKSYPGD